jgi:hypothetical protein
VTFFATTLVTLCLAMKKNSWARSTLFNSSSSVFVANREASGLEKKMKKREEERKRTSLFMSTATAFGA